MDEFFRSQQGAPSDSQINSAFVSPPRNGAQLPRRFTTDSSRVPTLSSITPIMTTQRPPEPQDFATTTVSAAELSVQAWLGASERHSPPVFAAVWNAG